jgi:plastocyanin
MRNAFTLSLGALVCWIAPAAAQSTLDRSPTVGEAWVPDPGVVQFNLVHRFYVSPGPTHKVTNFPTFTVATGLGHAVGLGLRYGSNSIVMQAPFRPNELEVLGRVRLGTPAGTNGFGVAVTPAYNVTARSPDGEVAFQWTWHRVTLAGVARGLGKPFGQSGARVGLAGSAAIRVNRYVGISGDVGRLVHAAVGTVWSAGLTLAIPNSPHTFSLHASNAATTTIQGASKPLGRVLYGFEFTIPLHLSRFAVWFHGDASPKVAGTTDALNAPVGAVVTIKNLQYTADTVTVAVGQAVRWINDDPFVHSVAFDGAQGVSGLIAAGHGYAHLFTKAGTFSYQCAQHPMMHGVVVVR